MFLKTRGFHFHITVKVKPLDDNDVNFREFVSRRKEELGIQADRVFNMDEVPISFDAPHSKMLIQPPLKAFLFKPPVTRKLASLLYLRGRSQGKSSNQWSCLNTKQCQKKSSQMVWLSTVTAKERWIAKEWLFEARKFGNQHLCLLDRTSLLILDSFSAYIDEDVRNTFKNEHKTTTAVIPGGLTKKLQP